MYKIFPLILFSITTYTWGQVGIVSEIDGVLDVRSSPAGKTVDSIYDGALFFIKPDSEDSTWVAIKYGEGHKLGFVHHTKIKEIETLLPPKSSVPELIFYTGRINNLENRRFYGGMNLPLDESFELKEIDVVVKNDTISQDFKYAKDVLTPFLISGKYSHKELVSKGKLSLHSYKDFTYYRIRLGDGSEYYESIWAVRNGKIFQRVIGWPF